VISKTWRLFQNRKKKKKKKVEFKLKNKKKIRIVPIFLIEKKRKFASQKITESLYTLHNFIKELYIIKINIVFMHKL
jgi:hypothetical protein